MTDWLDKYENALEKSQKTVLCESPIARSIAVKERIYAEMMIVDNITRSEAQARLNTLIWDKKTAEAKAFKDLEILRFR